MRASETHRLLCMLYKWIFMSLYCVACTPFPNENARYRCVRLFMCLLDSFRSECTYMQSTNLAIVFQRFSILPRVSVFLFSVLSFVVRFFDVFSSAVGVGSLNLPSWYYESVPCSPVFVSLVSLSMCNVDVGARAFASVCVVGYLTHKCGLFHLIEPVYTVAAIALCDFPYSLPHKISKTLCAHV